MRQKTFRLNLKKMCRTLMILEDGRAFPEGGTANKGFETKKYRAGLNNRQIVQPLVRYLIEYTYDRVDPQR